ncbi:hypothetical protein AGMMS4957_19360 [Bacteroidia bacterium]|nr:hypothetical protein AGMMS4957_19360 [Bacteroidia bacterium]
MSIIIKPKVYAAIDNYNRYLIAAGLTTKQRANEKRELIIKALHTKLGGLLRHRVSPYWSFGRREGLLLYVYRDAKSRTQWGFLYRLFPDNNVIVYEMKPMNLVKG